MWQDQPIHSMMPTMKHAMTMALIATAILGAPAGHADPDPHKPDFGANYCPGGATADPASLGPSCDGVPYPDGSYWHATQRGASGTSSFVVVQCMVPAPPPGPFSGLLPRVTGPLPAPPGGCGQ
jgi:hypothetical protein